MQTIAAISEKLSPNDLRREIVKIISLWPGCASDLASQIGHNTGPADVLPILDGMTEEGLLRHKQQDPRDHREYKEPFQTVYEWNTEG